MKPTKKPAEPYVYVPSDGRINITNQPSEPPKTRYNRAVFDREIVKNKVTKGKDIK